MNLKKVFSTLLVVCFVLGGLPAQAVVFDPTTIGPHEVDVSTTTTAYNANLTTNLVVNGSFETDFIGISPDWNGEAARGLSNPTIGDADHGSRVLRISEQDVTPGEFPFTFQATALGSVAAGDTIDYTAEVRMTEQGASNQFPQIKLEFKDAGGVTIGAPPVANTMVVSPTFSTLSINAVAPATTSFVVFVIEMQNLGPVPPGPDEDTVFEVDSVQGILTPAGGGAFATNVTEGSGIENILNNPGFETAPNANNWDSTPNRGIEIITGGAPEGDRFLRLNENNLTAGSAGAFTFQTPDVIVRDNSYVTFSGLGRVNSLDGGKAAQAVIEYQDGAGMTFDTSIVALANITTDFIPFLIEANAPVGTKQITFTLRIQPSNVGGTSSVDFDMLQATVDNFPVGLNAKPSKSNVSAGDIFVMAVEITNRSNSAFPSSELVIDAQKGLNILPSDAGLNGDTNLTFTKGSFIYSLGNIAAGQKFVFAFPVVVTSGVVPGKIYSLTTLVQSGGIPISMVNEANVTVQSDPIFDQGDVIGKVFLDRNCNGVQDENNDEMGIPWANIVTEEGIIVTTDENGMYHIPGLKPGRHVLKIDGHTLPMDTMFVTEESLLIKTTPGILNKANFAVSAYDSSQREDWEGAKKPWACQEIGEDWEGSIIMKSLVEETPFSDDVVVTITQGLDTTPPQLDVNMSHDVLKLGVGVLEKNPTFTFDMNYPEFVQKWILEIRDEMGFKIWSGFGIGAPPAEVEWQGVTDKGMLIDPGLYSYQFKVEDSKGRQDWTYIKFFRVISKTEKVVSVEDWEGLTKEERILAAGYKGSDDYRAEIPPVGNFNIFKDGKRSIPVVAKPTVHVRGKTDPINQIYVNGYPIKVDGATGLFHKEFYVEPGETEFVVTAVTPEGESVIQSKTMQIKDSMFFMVALGEQELGYNFANGGIKATGQDEHYADGFYEDGRLSFYLKGKLKGKFFIRAHYDTDDDRSALFTNLDPDDYYPIYGDNSTRNYDAQNSSERFYALIEMNRSFAQWGSFQTEFDDTELGSYNRTISGFKGHYESDVSTAYGDPKSSLTMFWAESTHQAAHDELVSTGGSLYYTSHRNLIEGSEQLRIEVRDEIQDIAIGRYDLVEGYDYEMDYAQGRILLSRPISSIAAEHTVVENELMDGDHIFLIADYEYDAGFNAFENNNRGIRGFTHMGDHLKVGATLVEEKRNGEDYDLRAVDATLKIGRNTKITAEFATTILEQADQHVSYDGGLTYADLGLIDGKNTRVRENGYLIRAETKPMENLELNAFIQELDGGFSVDNLRSQEGMRKYGFASRWKIFDDLFMKYRFDNIEVSRELLPADENGLVAPYETLSSHSFGLHFDNAEWLAEVEYRRQDLDEMAAVSLTPVFETEVPFKNGIATKVGYRFNEKMLAYVKGQLGFGGKDNHQAGGGFRYRVANDIYAYMEQMIGNIGDSTTFGVERVRDNGSSTYMNLKSLDRGIGYRTLSTAIGTNYFLENGSRIFSEKEHSLHNGVDGFSDILGYDGRINDQWDFGGRIERRRHKGTSVASIDNSAALGIARTNTFNTVSGHVAYAGTKMKDGDFSNIELAPWKERIRARTFWEFRKDTDVTELWQIVTRNQLEYRVNRDMSVLTYLNYGYSRDQSAGNIPAGFTEFSIGTAYRPIDNDRLNFLARYTYLNDIANDYQFQNALFSGVEIDEISHVGEFDLIYDLTERLQITEKLAYKYVSVMSSNTNDVALHNFLWVNRLAYRVTKKWDVIGEYRILIQGDAAETWKHGALFEVDRELYDYVKLGIGYDFSDFTDDLKKPNDYSSHGPYVRMTGKF